jgi:hypothetical protein
MNWRLIWFLVSIVMVLGGLLGAILSLFIEKTEEMLSAEKARAAKLKEKPEDYVDFGIDLRDFSEKFREEFHHLITPTYLLTPEKRPGLDDTGVTNAKY